MNAKRYIAAMCLLLSTAASADDFTLTWYTIDAGGVMLAQSGDFTLSGTIGQPDAGATMTGDGFTLTGGFWAFPYDACPADMDGDGVVNPFDSNFVKARFGCAVGTGDEDCDRADIDGDGVVNPFDSNAVMANFGPCP